MATDIKILPIAGKRNVLITSALPYVNNVPHLGNIIGCVLSADVFARYCRLRGYTTLYICGTDEYGTATETKALEEGLTPQQICDLYHVLHHDIYKWFDISFDYFGRTTTNQQTEIAQSIFNKLNQNGYMQQGTLEQLFCSKCERYLADRYVEGICPLCEFQNDRGDQCDGCGKLLNPIELINPKCKICKSTPNVKSTHHLFLDLPKLTPELEQWLNKSMSSGVWTSNSTNLTKAWLREGLKPRCITRDLKWGTPVPLEGFENKVFYVWFDAPIGYISITANYTNEWEKWWKNPDQVELFQFMGKDNVPFHTVMFPSSLIGTKENWSLLNSISTTEYLTYEGKKFSKGRKIGVFGDQARDTGIPLEVLRYSLLVNRPESADADFNWEDLAAKNNGELLSNLGNFINRSLKFVSSNFNYEIPKINLTIEEETIKSLINEQLRSYIKAFEQLSIKEGLKILMQISAIGNKYLQDCKPWVLIKENIERCSTVIGFACQICHLLATLCEPYMPSLTKKILVQLQTQLAPLNENFVFHLAENHKIGEPLPLLQKIEKPQIDNLRRQFAGVQPTTNEQPSFLLEIKIGLIQAVIAHPRSEGSFILQVNVGESNLRQIVSGIKNYYQPQQLENRLVAVVCNLKQAKFQGETSQAMLLAAEFKNPETNQTIIELLQPQGNNELGSIVLPQGHIFDIKKRKLIDYKKDFLKLSLKIGENQEAFFDNHKLLINSTAPLSVSQVPIGSLIK
eukprot:TRINITY_DN4121_c0_g1_i1.p1 TRINITY_DN4121_c0_g1~~TRINITY_DN4121_c0_g1_i1.p1  ORF type:complete len:740 (+),score=349.49 TRINITY_DN4121_c0_g1_i1:72-2291(+)